MADGQAIPLHGIGHPVPRKEDDALVRGQGRFSDDHNLPGQAYAAFVRSQNAHGIIRAIDVQAALAAPSVLAVYTGRDLHEAGRRPQPPGVTAPNRDG